MRRYVLAAIVVLGFASLAHADDVPSQRKPSFSRSDDVALCKAFGVLSPTDQQEFAPTALGSARNATALETWAQYLLTCNVDVRIKQGNSAVTAAATNTILPVGAMLRFLTGPHTHIAAFGDPVAGKCTVTRMLCGLNAE